MGIYTNNTSSKSIGFYWWIAFPSIGEIQANNIAINLLNITKFGQENYYVITILVEIIENFTSGI